jgi:hypothetical protein
MDALVHPAPQRIRIGVAVMSVIDRLPPSQENTEFAPMEGWSDNRRLA